jgi:Skp family chaperone for outer membrane proteins
MKNMATLAVGKRARTAVAVFAAALLIPAFAFPVTLVRVGYIDLEAIIQTYIVKYMSAEIEIRTAYASQLQTNYNVNYARMSEKDRIETLRKIKDQRDAVALLKNNMSSWNSSGDVLDEIIFQIVQRDIIEAIKKTSEIEGFSLVLDKTGNFVYGSDDIDLTDKVLFRLDEKLLDLQSKPPLVPLSLELEEASKTISTETVD